MPSKNRLLALAIPVLLILLCAGGVAAISLLVGSEISRTFDVISLTVTVMPTPLPRTRIPTQITVVPVDPDTAVTRTAPTFPPTPPPTYTPTPTPSSRAAMPDACSQIDWNPPELTFEVAYCQGDFCRAETQVECESIDVLAGEGIVSGADGLPDCMWVAVMDDLNACRPNR